MPLFARNVKLGPALKISAWRKIAIGTWVSAGDPSVYGMMEVEVTTALAYLEKLRAHSGEKLTLTHFVGKAVAEVMKRHPEINCILRMGRIYPRRDIDIFFQVATDMSGEDLSGTTIRQADTKGIVTIAREMDARVKKIRARQDPTYVKTKKTMGAFPGFLSHALLSITGFIMYALNIWSPLLGAPQDAFGSVMITSIGSLGVDMAFAPLVPYSRVPVLLAVGAATDAAIVRDGQVRIGKMMKLCTTIDHRIIDGVHASKMSKTLQKIFEDPERELGPAH